MPPTQSANSTPQTQKPQHGPTFGILIILVVLVFGAFYFWGQRLNNQESNPPVFIPDDASSTPQTTQTE